MQNESPKDPVELLREIRNRKYEERKHMTREEVWALERESVERFEKLMKEPKSGKYDFSWLHRKQEKSEGVS
jgi:hypothetical protein